MSSGSNTRVRKNILTLRLSADERAAIDASAERSGLAIGSYAREVLLEAPSPRAVRRPPIERRELGRLLGELGKVGSNLNQIAKSLHTGILVYEVEIQRELDGLAAVREAILKALGRDP